MLSEDEADYGFVGISDYEKEKLLRDKYPTLQEAYNTMKDAKSKYAMLLKILKSQG